ncbi:carbonic anhydrase [Streptomyces lomondensis]|uniref:Carbonic anhydrase n=1 Tax=Streptomyces lomondensis TaxID=68229 RepID=A0ABQ2XTH4_9ACTN|nr:carbonic anhydrase [Streptomyces lomondensis]MCF0082453.1 carbonic anhydrase [Streptomyces lomondensis]GGX33611.1 carbonic anhydrase [Streptomyces lomondensis]
MKKFIDNARSFREAAAGSEEFAALAKGQSPEVLFITCSDSRVLPMLITGARPGEIFELQTAGNVVPDYGWEQPSGEAATIEYAVEVLGVSHIVVCGHSHCGAVGAVVRGDDLSAVPAVRAWLAHAAAKPEGAHDDPAVAEAVQNHVLAQLARLRSFPGIARRLEEGRIQLHAWFYEVHTGTVLTHDPQTDSYNAL